MMSDEFRAKKLLRDGEKKLEVRLARDGTFVASFVIRFFSKPRKVISKFVIPFFVQPCHTFYAKQLLYQMFNQNEPKGFIVALVCLSIFSNFLLPSAFLFCVLASRRKIFVRFTHRGVTKNCTSNHTEFYISLPLMLIFCRVAGVHSRVMHATFCSFHVFTMTKNSVVAIGRRQITAAAMKTRQRKVRMQLFADERTS